MNPIRRNSKIFSFLKKPSSPISPTSLSPAHGLDSVILRKIFNFFLPDTYEAALRFHRGVAAFEGRSNTVSRPHQGQIDLLHAIHTCRIWYTAGVQLLYTRVFLVNVRAIGAWAKQRGLCGGRGCSRERGGLSSLHGRRPFVHIRKYRVHGYCLRR